MDKLKPIVLVGMMGCGKSVIGARLASNLKLKCYDSDKIIADEQEKSIAQIFADEGENYFRALEASKIAELLDIGACIISTGGGALNSPQTLHNIKDKAISVWLNSDIDAIYNRIKHDKRRPLLQCKNPRAKLEDLLNQRKALYTEADIHIDNSAVDIYMVTKNILQKLKDYNAN